MVDSTPPAGESDRPTRPGPGWNERVEDESQPRRRMTRSQGRLASSPAGEILSRGENDNGRNPHPTHPRPRSPGMVRTISPVAVRPIPGLRRQPRGPQAATADDRRAPVRDGGSDERLGQKLPPGSTPPVSHCLTPHHLASPCVASRRLASTGAPARRACRRSVPPTCGGKRKKSVLDSRQNRIMMLRRTHDLSSPIITVPGRDRHPGWKARGDGAP